MEEQDQARLITIVAGVAGTWREPDYETRQEAVEKTLSDETTYTEESLAFVINQTMHQLTETGLSSWLNGRRAKTPKQVGVLNADSSFFVEVQDVLSVLLTGHHYFGVISPESPYLLRAFTADLQVHFEKLPVVFGTEEDLFKVTEAVVASSDEEGRASIEEACERRGVPEDCRLIRHHRYAVAVMDGRESKQDLENLAEDLLLHDGHNRRNVKLIWASQSVAPDSLLDAMAEFRSVFPAHPSIPGSLKMQQAFLDALKIPNAYGEGMEFLLSKGKPDIQRPGHVRWTEYGNLDAVTAWLQEHRKHVELVVGRPSLTGQLDCELPFSDFGDAQRPPLGWHPGGVDTVAFLARM